MFERLNGKIISLRLVTAADASYIYSLRMNPAYNQHLSPVTGTVEDQRNWINTYKLREAEGLEYYFVIERLDGVACGVVRLYNINNGTFTWGSWILDHNKPGKAALESALLVYEFGLEILNLKNVVFEVRLENARVIAFHHRFGAKETARDAQNSYFELTRDTYLQNKPFQLQSITSLHE